MREVACVNKEERNLWGYPGVLIHYLFTCRINLKSSPWLIRLSPHLSPHSPSLQLSFLSHHNDHLSPLQIYKYYFYLRVPAFSIFFFLECSYPKFQPSLLTLFMPLFKHLSGSSYSTISPKNVMYLSLLSLYFSFLQIQFLQKLSRTKMCEVTEDFHFLPLSFTMDFLFSLLPIFCTRNKPHEAGILSYLLNISSVQLCV